MISACQSIREARIFNEQSCGAWLFVRCSRSREHMSACQTSIPRRTAFHPVRGARICAVQFKTNGQADRSTVPRWDFAFWRTCNYRKAFYGLSGRLVQLARTLPSHGRGHRFESCNAHQIPADFPCLFVGGSADMSSFAIGTAADLANGKKVTGDCRDCVADKPSAAFCGAQELLGICGK